MSPGTGSFYCDKFDAIQCKNDNITCETSKIKCELHYGVEPACFAIWTNSSDKGVVLLHKGCWQSDADLKQCSQTECVTNKPQTRTNLVTYFCCCEKANCNEDVYFNATSTLDLSENVDSTYRPPIRHRVDLLNGCLFVVVPILIVAALIFLFYTIYRNCRYKNLSKTTVRTPDTSTTTFSSPPTSKNASTPLISGEPLSMIDIIARGRFGCVWKARRGDDVVAVKIFPPQASESWLQEQDIYSLPPLSESENVLHFIGAEERGEGLNLQYYLITEYHANGSLYDYLKAHTLDLKEFLHVSTSMLKGLAYLHEEIIKTDKIYKPTIVHRDFKSRNVLLKKDLTAVIADFGLALKCEHGRTPKDTHNQVGTHRYMAPEVLESATEFSAFAFKQIDVYAAALVLWEVMSRCKYNDEPLAEYKLPYEEEVGCKPSLIDMQELVVSKRKRPILKPNWISHQVLSGVCKTVEEMWDVEPEARITAGCALERFFNVAAPSDINDYVQDTTPLIHLNTR